MEVQKVLYINIGFNYCLFRCRCRLLLQVWGEMVVWTFMQVVLIHMKLSFILKVLHSLLNGP